MAQVRSIEPHISSREDFLMDILEKRRLNMFIRVRAFGEKQAADFPAESAGALGFTTVNEVISRLAELHDDQTGKKGTRQEQVTTKSSARRAIRDDLRAINRTALSLAIEQVGLDKKFRLPRSGGDQALLSAARNFITEARPLRSEFVRHDLPADFIEDLEADIAMFERINAGQASTTIGSVQVTRQIDEAFKHGMEAIKRLDAIVRNKYRGNPALIAAWETAIHVERSAGKAVASSKEATTT